MCDEDEESGRGGRGDVAVMSMVAGLSLLGIGCDVDPRALGAGVPQDEQKRTFANNSTPQDEQYPITFVCNSLL